MRFRTVFVNPVTYIDFSQTTEHLHLLLTAAHSTKLVQCNHAGDYGFVVTKSRLQITKDYTGITGQVYEIIATLWTPRRRLWSTSASPSFTGLHVPPLYNLLVKLLNK